MNARQRRDKLAAIVAKYGDYWKLKPTEDNARRAEEGNRWRCAGVRSAQERYPECAVTRVDDYQVATSFPEFDVRLIWQTPPHVRPHLAAYDSGDFHPFEVNLPFEDAAMQFINHDTNTGRVSAPASPARLASLVAARAQRRNGHRREHRPALSGK